MTYGEKFFKKKKRMRKKNLLYTISMYGRISSKKKLMSFFARKKHSVDLSTNKKYPYG